MVMYKNLKAKGFGSFRTAYKSAEYWSSEYYGLRIIAWSQDFYSGDQHDYGNRDAKYYVRAVRAF